MVSNRQMLKFFSDLALAGALLLALRPSSAQAAQLIVFEQPGCVYCQEFNRQIGATYDKTEFGLIAPLRPVDIDKPLPPDLAFIRVERLTPLFVLVDNGREIGRIRGYGGRKMFWTQFYALIQKLDKSEPPGVSAQLNEAISAASG